jgi:hypothetical protein
MVGVPEGLTWLVMPLNLPRVKCSISREHWNLLRSTRRFRQTPRKGRYRKLAALRAVLISEKIRCTISSERATLSIFG